MGRFDLSFKSLAERSVLTLVRRFGSRPIDDATVIEPVERELAMSIKSVDHAFVLERAGERWLEHFEAELVLMDEDLSLILQRAAMLSIKKDAPVWTTIILLSRRHARSRPLPEALREDRGCLQFTMQLRIIKLWEMRPEEMLDDPNLDVLPVIGAMNATPEELDRVIERLSAEPDRERRSRLNAEMVTWSSLQYDKDKVADIRSRLKMVTTKEILMASPIGEEILQYGRAEGREEGREEGQLGQARRSLALLLESRFPGLAGPAALDRLNDLAVIESLFRAILAAGNLEEASAALAKT